MRIEYTATLESAFHHGAGVSGNTARLRTQEVVRPDGTLAHVPFLSANSIRHGLRNALAWHLAKTLDFADSGLTKGEVTLLWSGGGITKTGAQANLELARQANNLIPMLGLLGYAAGSDIISGTLRASDAILVCEENQSRLPIPATTKAAHYRGEEFGTRHDLDGSPVARFMDLAAQDVGSSQMIYSLQTLKPGTALWEKSRPTQQPPPNTRKHLPQHSTCGHQEGPCSLEPRPQPDTDAPKSPPAFPYRMRHRGSPNSSSPMPAKSRRP